MKRVRINPFEKGLVYRNGSYLRMLNPGTYWLMPWEEVKIYSTSYEFTDTNNLEILLKDIAFVSAVELIEVKNNEIALQFTDGIFRKVYNTGRYIFWKGLINYEFKIINLNKVEMITETGSGIDKSIFAGPLLIGYVRNFTVESFERGVMMINGKFERILEPGTYYFWKNNTSISVLRADMRNVQLEIPGQEILTKDKASLRINFYVQYKIADIIKALVENKEFEKQLYVLMQLSLRTLVGTYTLDELLEKKDMASSMIAESVKAKSEALGITLTGAGIRDIILPGDMKDIMNKVLVAEKTAQANSIMRREETASTRSLLNTAKLMEENSMLFRLKEMEYVEKIAEKINSINLGNNSLIGDQLKEIFVRNK